MKFFNYDSPISEIFTKIAKFFVLNLLWIICSLPIITMGASTAALYYCMLRIARKEDAKVTEMFFHAFKQNLKQGCILTILFLACGLFLYADIRVCQILDNTLCAIIKIFLLLFTGVYAMTFSYVFPLLAQFENDIKTTLKNAFIMSIGYLHKTIVIVILNALPVAIFFLVEELFILSFPIWITFGFSLIAYVNSKLLKGTFDALIDKYIHTEE